MRGILLTFDRQLGLAELLHKSYAAKWADMPVRFRVPFNGEAAGPALTYLRNQPNCEFVRCTSAIDDTMRALLEGIPDDEWVFWAVDDRYPTQVAAPRCRSLVAALPSLGQDIEEVKLLQFNEQLTSEAVGVGGQRFYMQGPVKRQWGFWHHHFIRAGVLRRVFLHETLPPAPTIRDVQTRIMIGEADCFRGRALVPHQPLVKLSEPLRAGRLTTNGLRDLRRFKCEVPDYRRVDKEIDYDAAPLPPKARRYYSQNGEDLLLWSLFGGQQAGFFVDIGAFDGVHYSNSLSFEEQGWTGICVEANPRYFPLCERVRPRSTCVFAACVGRDGGDRATLLTEPLGLLSGIRANETPNLPGRYALRNMEFPGFKSIEVPATTLDRLLAKHPPPQSGIDFLSIDVEGTELDVLKGFSRRARVVVAEANGPAEARALTDYLGTRGYQLARTLKQNLFFVRRREDAKILREARLTGVTERTLHPLGIGATVLDSVGKSISIDPVVRRPLAT